MRRRRLIGRLLALPLLRRHRCCSCSGLRQRAVDAHRLSVEAGFRHHPQHRNSAFPHFTCAGLTCATIPLMSPLLLGNRMVLDSLASCEKAETYCSATLSDAAAFPFCRTQKKLIQRHHGCLDRVHEQQQLTWRDRASDRTRIAFDLASALAKTAWASPEGTETTFNPFIKATAGLATGTRTRTHRGLG